MDLAKNMTPWANNVLNCQKLKKLFYSESAPPNDL
jgi:hypothetical protein